MTGLATGVSFLTEFVTWNDAGSGDGAPKRSKEVSNPVKIGRRTTAWPWKRLDLVTFDYGAGIRAGEHPDGVLLVG